MSRIDKMVINSVKLNKNLIYVGQSIDNKKVAFIEAASSSTDRNLEEIILVSNKSIIAVLRNYTGRSCSSSCRPGTTIIEKVKFNGNVYSLGQYVNGMNVTEIGIINRENSPDTRVYFYSEGSVIITSKEMCEFLEFWYRPYSLPF